MKKRDEHDNHQYIEINSSVTRCRNKIKHLMQINK